MNVSFCYQLIQSGLTAIHLEVAGPLTTPNRTYRPDFSITESCPFVIRLNYREMLNRLAVRLMSCHLQESLSTGRINMIATLSGTRFNRLLMAEPKTHVKKLTLPKHSTARAAGNSFVIVSYR